jgi:effector-binding domain-containing protein
MKNFILNSCLILIVSMIVFSCNNKNDFNAAEKTKKDTLLQQPKLKILDFNTINNNPGIIGVYFVPEMLTLCKTDSAPMRKVSSRISKAFEILEKDLNLTKAISNGMPGMLTYNNDTSNFIFECVLPIKEIPKKQPTQSKIVILEATPMLIFNFYGPYQHLFSAYDKIRKYLTEAKLVQTGPMREFYLTDPSIEKDEAKWQTRIMVPVVQAK